MIIQSRRYHIVLTSLLLLATALLIFLLQHTDKFPLLARPSQVAYIGEHKLYLQIADTEQTRQTGLGGQTKQLPNQGMLFVFPASSVQCFWMKDMRFDLDMLWFDDQKQLIYLLQDVPANSYPKSYCPPRPAHYVVEVNAGRSKELGLKKGDQLSIRYQTQPNHTILNGR